MIAAQGSFQDGLPVKPQAALHLEMGQFVGMSPIAYFWFGHAQELGDFV